LVGTLPQSLAPVDRIGVRPVLELAPTVLVGTTATRLDRPPRA
jgi:hypothetical protein